MIDNTGKVRDHIDISKILDMDHDSTSMSGFHEPLICVCFMAPNDDIFVSTYHRL